MISRLSLYRLAIPFKLAFKHHSAERAETETVWVEADGHGVQGYGEGCPRMYVTNEDIASSAAFFEQHCGTLCRNVKSVEDLRLWMRAHGEDIARNPAAWCAIELSILDLLSRQDSVPVESIQSREPANGLFRYSAVIGDSPADQFRAIASQYAAMGFADFKIKVSGDLARDREKIAILSSIRIQGLRVRADANNLWSDPETAARHLTRLDCAFAGLEEPVGAGQFDAMRYVAQETHCPIILDESLLGPDQIPLLAADRERWIINVRVSKMGGLLRSLDAVARARQAGIPVIAGAHVGETSLLTRAGMIVAQAAGEGLFAQEGAFGTRLLESDVSEPSLMFGHAGILDAAPWDFARKSGWGLGIQPGEGSRHLLSDSKAR